MPLFRESHGKCSNNIVPVTSLSLHTHMYMHLRYAHANNA